jgi:Sushi repeat (SCR repeat)
MNFLKELFGLTVETTKISNIQQRIENSETMTHSVDGEGMLFECFTLSQNEPLVVHLTEQRRLSGVRITSGTSKSDVIYFQRANFKFTGGQEQIPYERNLNESISLFVFENSNQRASSQSVEIVSTKSFQLCQLEMYALVDQCGHPEIPINGTVTWQRGSTIATYSCHEGYALERITVFDWNTRTCQNGKWSGSELRCKFFLMRKHSSCVTAAISSCFRSNDNGRCSLVRDEYFDNLKESN